MKQMKCFFDFKEEEKWLDEMSRKGYQLTERSAFGTYTFEESAPQKRNYKIDYQYFKNESDYNEYKEIFLKSGWVLVAGSAKSGNQYFYSDDGGKDIFSDQSSRAGRYKRLANMYVILACIWAALILPMFLNGSATLFNFTYLTPGLWEKTGFAFWRAFLFETPFAIMRGIGPLFFFVSIGLYIVFALQSRTLYKKAMDED